MATDFSLTAVKFPNISRFSGHSTDNDYFKVALWVYGKSAVLYRAFDLAIINTKKKELKPDNEQQNKPVSLVGVDVVSADRDDVEVDTL